ncbi:MAG TPA: short chain dehydrogenase [Gallionella sp.]|jgi:citronellol/citronellal dehydrogenase|nr:NAD(P)-dependent oxidoreductase [Gallionella sp.]OGS67335.1 MAG: short chain dehydrogenase [Gallionellales bacterium GWA2_54_124]HCI52149.1 short chain dehydrogenase [Gallionella sp.]
MRRDLRDKVVLISGSTRGIGREIALRCARDGAKVVITGKTVRAHDRLPGTIHSVADEVRQAGGQALAVELDVRDERGIAEAVDLTVDHFGGLDVLVNNASAISLTSTLDTSAKRLDLMLDVNMRATFLMSQACIPHLLKAANPHILTLSPPLNFQDKWLAPHLAYTMSKYGMSLCMMGLAAEFPALSVNCLWPRTTIATAAIEYHFPEEILRASRHPAIVADAAWQILTGSGSGNFYIDEDVLRLAGVSDFAAYAVSPATVLYRDLFLDE